MKSFHRMLPALCAAAILLVLPMTACSSAVRAEHTDSSPVAPREIPDENGSEDPFRIPLPRELPGIHRQAPGKPAMPHPPEDGRFRKGKGKHHEMPAPDSSRKKGADADGSETQPPDSSAKPCPRERHAPPNHHGRPGCPGRHGKPENDQIQDSAGITPPSSGGMPEAVPYNR